MKKNSKTSTSKKLKVYDRRKPITDWPQYANAFPYRLEYLYNNDKIIAYFECTQHLNKYLLRYNLNNKNSRVDVYNNTGSTLNKGEAVYLTGGNQGDNPNVALADSDDVTKMPALGIVRENSIIKNDDDIDLLVNLKFKKNDYKSLILI